MNFFLALICLITGLACLAWYKSISTAYAEFMGKRLREYYGDYAIKMKWDDPRTWQWVGYKIGMIGVGLFFIALAYYLVFGTIHIGS